AFRALNEFADLCPDQDDVRLMLADQLSRLGRKNEAVEQLQLLYERYHGEGRTAEAAATAERMLALDPTAEPRAATGVSRKSTAELVFLDLDEAPPPQPAAPAPEPARAARPSMPAAQPPRATPTVPPVATPAPPAPREAPVVSEPPDVAPSLEI